MKLGIQCKKMVDAYGNTICKKDGVFHRVDGPAFQSPDGTQYWYKHGGLHRANGPAVTYSDGTKRWFFDNKEYTENNYKRKLEGLEEEYEKPIYNYWQGESGSLTGYYNTSTNWINTSQSIYVGTATSNQINSGGYLTYNKTSNRWYIQSK